MIERRFLTEKDAAIQELLTAGYELILLDLDDTILLTHIEFENKMGDYTHAVADMAGLNKFQEQIFKEIFFKFNRLTLVIDGISVCPEKWEWLANHIGKIHPFLLEPMVANLEILDQIYKAVPGKVEGVEEFLDDAKKAGFKLAILTHGSPEWTEGKLKGAGIWTLFDPKLIYTVSVYGFKEDIHWDGAIRKSGSIPAKTIVVGNNLDADIKPADILGAVTVLIRDEAHDLYFVQGNIPPNTIVRPNFNGFFPAVSSALFSR
jgi:FMN phosphatase YigB (HAD superfamily)